MRMPGLEEIRELVSRAPVFDGKRVLVTVIQNPVAGGFAIKKRAEQNSRWFAAALESVRSRPELAGYCSVDIRRTTHAGHARTLARAVIEDALSDASRDTIRLIVSAGGDGTSLDIQNELARAFLEQGEREVADRICILRLPFGTGNDGCDGRTLDETLSILTGRSRFERQCAVCVSPAGEPKRVWYAFNIASIGIDAFITDMTNRVKRFFPGNFYKIWIDIACLFYNRIYRIGQMRVDAFLRDGTAVRSDTDRFALYLMGASGHRTYGSNQKILPGTENVCGIREMSLVRKLTLKGRVRSGKHAEARETLLYSADRIEIRYGEPVLVQLDGEARLLSPQDFPLVMELSEPFITVLKPV